MIFVALEILDRLRTVQGDNRRPRRETGLESEPIRQTRQRVVEFRVAEPPVDDSAQAAFGRVVEPPADAIEQCFGSSQLVRDWGRRRCPRSGMRRLARQCSPRTRQVVGVPGRGLHRPRRVVGVLRRHPGRLRPGLHTFCAHFDRATGRDDQRTAGNSRIT